MGSIQQGAIAARFAHGGGQPTLALAPAVSDFLCLDESSLTHKQTSKD